MKLSAIALGIAAAIPSVSATVQGFDISNWQSSVNFAGAYSSGARFVMIKSSEGTSYKDPSFNSHYTGATKAKFIRGGYHFALPDKSSGKVQAEWFLKNGGGWSNDGITLPGMLDMETNPYGSKCYGKSASAMVAWIKDFSDTYNSKTGRPPMIYTSPDWWKTCTGNSNAFSQTCPLVLAAWSSSPPSSPPGGWPHYSFWQNADTYKYGGDSEIWNGSIENLKKFAKGG